MPAATATPEPDPPEAPNPRVLGKALPSSWHERAGGLELFNRLLARNLAEAGHLVHFVGHGTTGGAHHIVLNTCSSGSPHADDAVDAVMPHGGRDGQPLMLQGKHWAATADMSTAAVPVLPSRPEGFHGRWEEALFRDDVQAFRMVPASKATLFASEVQTQQDMGVALRLLREEAGLTIDQLYNRVKPLKIACTGRSTIGRVFAGGTLCATSEALVALVTACGVDDADTEIWVAAWERARASQNPRGRRTTAASTPDTPLVDHGQPGSKPTDEGGLEPVSSDKVPAVDVPNLVVVDAFDGLGDTTEDGSNEGPSWDDDEVIGTVQITRGHLRAAVVLSAVAGVAAMSSQAPGVRNTGAAVLGVAGVIALLDMIRNGTIAGTTSAPHVVSDVA